MHELLVHFGFALYLLIMSWQERIEVNPKIVTGKPVIKGTRISVELIIELLAGGWSYDDILRNYPHLKQDDILACLNYVNDLMHEVRVYPIPILQPA